MSIDAVITDVRRNPDGTATIALGPRETPYGQSCEGQRRITIENPPPGRLDGLVGTEVWGGSESLMVGDTKWADRVGYTRARLVRR
jgi:hypothetical protein